MGSAMAESSVGEISEFASSPPDKAVPEESRIGVPKSTPFTPARIEDIAGSNLTS